MNPDSIHNLLFDLDGTLVDSSGTISASLAYALERTGPDFEGGPPVESLIGRPLFDIFRSDFGMNAEQIDAAVDHYREHYDRLDQAGTTVYRDVPAVLSSLREAGFLLFIATVKPTPIAEKVLLDLQLRDYFEGVAGASMDHVRRDKTSIIAHALESFGLDSSHSLMIGDRDQDINGARENGLRSLAVTWGYGSRAELAAAGPDYTADRSAEIPALLTGHDRV